MDPISGALSLAGGIYANYETNRRQEAAQAFNAEQAALNRNFQENMSSHAYKRGMEDMKEAGLNPILAYQKGPASSPSGAMASTAYTPATDVVTPALNSAMAKTRLDAEVDNMRQTNVNLQETEKLIRSQKLNADANTANTAAETLIKNEALQVARREAEKGKIDEAFYNSAAGNIIRMIGNTLGELNPLTRMTPRVTVRPYQP